MSTHADIVAAATPQTATTSPVVVAAAAAQTAMISAAVALASPDLAEASGTGTVRGPSRHRGSGGDPEGIRGDPRPKRGIRLFRGLRFVGDPPPPISPFIILNEKRGLNMAVRRATETSRAPLIPRPVCERETSRILSPAAVPNVMTSNYLQRLSLML